MTQEQIQVSFFFAGVLVKRAKYDTLFEAIAEMNAWRENSILHTFKYETIK